MHQDTDRATLVIEALETRVFLSVQLVSDVDTDTLSSDPAEFVSLGDHVLFFASQPDGKFGLWSTDGTTAGTTLVKGGLARISGDGFRPIPTGGKIYFQTVGNASQYQLWMSDGTPAGTQPVSLVTPPDPQLSRQFVSFAGRVFFQASDPSTGTELWSTDGTPAGTSPFMDLIPGSNSSFPSGLTVSGGYLFFSTIGNNGNGITLWRTDGTVQNTIQLGQFAQGPGGFIDFGGKLIFTAANLGEYADQLWESDGTVHGTKMILDLSPNNSGSPTEFLIMNGNLYFRGPVGPNNVSTLWRSDGTAANTSPVVPDPPTGFNPTALRVSGSQIFFYASDPAAGRELWRSDGTTDGTYRTMDVNPGTAASIPAFVPAPPFVAPAKGGAYFFASDGTLGTEAWFSDGTQNAGGTFLLKDIYPGYFQGVDSSNGAVLANGQFIFNGRDPSLGNEPYVSDSTTVGTKPLLDIETRTIGSGPSEIIDAAGVPLIAALPPYVLQDHTKNEFQRSLFRVDPSGGSVASFLSLAAPVTSEATPLTGRGKYANATLLGKTYYFSTEDNNLTGLQRLHRTDGTAGGTQTFGTYYAQSGEIALMGGFVYFTATTQTSTANGVALYRTDGTTTQRVSPVIGGTAAHPFVSGNTLYFSISGELYRITNQDAGATDIGFTGGGVLRIAAAGNRVFFTRTVIGAPGAYLGATDDVGTNITTILGAISGDLVPFKGKLYFRGDSNLFCVSDGTTAGTKALTVNGKNVTAFNLRVAGDYLYFVSNDGIHGSEWWRSDGTDAGTSLWQDMEPNSGGSDPSNIVGVGADFARSIVQWRGSIYFTAQTSAVGAELWRVPATGAAAPPVLVADLYPGSTGSDPAALTVIGDQLYFVATRPDVGRELFKVVDDVPPQIVDASFDPAGLGKIGLHLSENVTISGAAAPPTLLNRTTGMLAPAGTLTGSFDSATGLLTLAPGAALTDGDYRLTIPAAWITDASGNPLSADFTFDFFVLPGDINRDRSVNFNDLVILAQNYGTGGKTIAQGDINGDGNVDFNDLAILAQRYGTSLPPPPVAAISPAPAPVAAASSIVRDRPAAKPLFSVTPVAKPAAKPKAALRQQRGS